MPFVFVFVCELPFGVEEGEKEARSVEYCCGWEEEKEAIEFAEEKLSTFSLVVVVGVVDVDGDTAEGVGMISEVVEEARSCEMS